MPAYPYFTSQGILAFMTKEFEPPRLPIPGDSLGAVDRLVDNASDIRQKQFTRPVTSFISKDGEKFRAAADQIEVSEITDPSDVRVWLKTHNKEIVMTIGGILLAASLINLQRNRSQRKKMSSRESSYYRKPRNL